MKRTIILGVTGSIAAYKAAEIASLLVKADCAVHVIMTANATHFIAPLTFKTLTRNPVTVSLFDEEPGVCNLPPSTSTVERLSRRSQAKADGASSLERSKGITHIELADQADLLLIAPVTANVIAKLAHGLADDALSAVALATRAPLLLAPAMNGKMWEHPATRENVKILKQRGVKFIGPEKGMLACGYQGIGRLWDPQEIAQRAVSKLKVKN